MELQLIRRYYPEGTRGVLLCKKQRVCYTIEQPWVNNQSSLSCIPEGRYCLRRRCATRSQWSLHVENVRSRGWILIQALQDHQQLADGIIVPVSLMLGRVRGIMSGAAMRKLLAVVTHALDNNQPVYFTIKTKQR